MSTTFLMSWLSRLEGFDMRHSEKERQLPPPVPLAWGLLLPVVVSPARSGVWSADRRPLLPNLHLRRPPVKSKNDLHKRDGANLVAFFLLAPSWWPWHLLLIFLALSGVGMR